jgi:D-alanine-D-alanine ligase
MKVAVIQGGPSTESAVSRVSARAVVGALREAGHSADAFELAPGLGGELSAAAPDVVFPVTHGTLGEDGCLQGMLEVLGLPYVGSGVTGSAIAADKVLSKLFFERAGLPVARQVVVRRGQPASLEEVRRVLGPEIIVKPATGGSTIGIRRLLGAAAEADLQAALAEAHALDGAALIETYVRGLELTTGVLEDEAGPRALPPIAIEAQATDWYDFESKYKPGGSRHVCPAPLEPALLARVGALAEQAHSAVGARDLSRTDLILGTSGELILLEVNTLPGFTPVSLFPEAAAAAGLAFPELVDRLVRRAATRSSAYAASDRARGRALPGS